MTFSLLMTTGKAMDPGLLGPDLVVEGHVVDVRPLWRAAYAMRKGLGLPALEMFWTIAVAAKSVRELRLKDTRTEAINFPSLMVPAKG
jgi:hypothetical protein